MMADMNNDILKVLITEEELKNKVQELGAAISRDYEGKNLLMVSVLKGSVIFMADLMRAITIPAQIDFMSVSSYGAGVKSSGVVKILKDLDALLEGKDLLLVEDILDSGLTLYYLREILTKRNPASIKLPPCWISRRGARRISTPIMWDLPSPMHLWWVTAWIITRYTATCPMWAY